VINRTGWKVPGSRALPIAICTLGLVWTTVAPALATAPRASIASAGTITATWSGRVDWSDVYDPADPSIDLVTAGVSWQYSITVRATPSGGAVVGKPQLKVSGGISETAAPPNQGLDCTGTFSARPSAPVSQFGPVGIVYEAPRWTLDAFIPDTGQWVASSAGSQTRCATVPNGGSPSAPCGPSISPTLTLRPRRLPWTRTYTFSGVGRSAKGAVDCWMSGSATLTFSGSGGSAPPVPLTPGRFRAKALATIALQATYERMLYPCIATAAALPLIALGPPGQIAAITIGAIGGTLCGAYTKTVNDLAQVIKDPPLRSYTLTARPAPVPARPVSLPPCTRWNGAAATFCAQLEPRLQKVVSTAQRVLSVAAAMRTTISRESGALAARNNGAVRKQDGILSGLDRQLLTAEAAQTQAGASVASLLGAAALPVTLSGAQSASAAHTVIQRLGALGLSKSKLLSLLAAVKNPGPYNWALELAS
jgi:hypothetical protein